jgi:hypothetical protein
LQPAGAEVQRELVLEYIFEQQRQLVAQVEQLEYQILAACFQEA